MVDRHLVNIVLYILKTSVTLNSYSSLHFSFVIIVADFVLKDSCSLYLASVACKPVLKIIHYNTFSETFRQYLTNFQENIPIVTLVARMGEKIHEMLLH